MNVVPLVTGNTFAANRRTPLVGRGGLGMTFLTGDLAVRALKRIGSLFVVIEGHQDPGPHVMARLTLLAKRQFVLVMLLMAGIAVASCVLVAQS
ncbi:MAG: hypothetical protein RL300_691 [Pseudomonadota bacterium]|jgi:hypothetical protein